MTNSKSLNRFISPKNQFFGLIIKELENKNWSDIEELYFQRVMNSNSDQITILNKEFEVIKKKLEDYLTNTIKYEKSLASYSSFFNKLNSRETLILNFNYSKSLQNLYANETSNCRIINLHGELNNKENPIIFGYAASERENYELLEKNNSEFLINIKAYNYKKTDLEKYLKNYYENTEYYDSDIFIIGHSCSLSDRNILNQLFNVGMLEKIIILYYKNFENYRETLINVHRIMDSNDNYEKVLNYDNSLCAPQLSDTDIEIKTFEEKLRNY